MYVFFTYFMCFFVSPYFYHDAFMHHTMQVLDAPGHTFLLNSVISPTLYQRCSDKQLIRYLRGVMDFSFL